jgi:hypothetical protein
VTEVSGQIHSAAALLPSCFLGPPRAYVGVVTSQTPAAAANRTLSSCMEQSPS